jgi:hypothetical protein
MQAELFLSSLQVAPVSNVTSSVPRQDHVRSNVIKKITGKTNLLHTNRLLPVLCELEDNVKVDLNVTRRDDERWTELIQHRARWHEW